MSELSRCNSACPRTNPSREKNTRTDSRKRVSSKERATVVRITSTHCCASLSPPGCPCPSVTVRRPRLLLILRPITMSHSGMAIRLLVCTVLCICLFGAHIIWYAQLVVAPPHRVYWWYIYGALELFPAIAFLIIMHPNVGSNNDNDNDNKREDDTPPDATAGHQHASQPRFLSSALDAPDIGKMYPSSNAALLTRSLSSGGSINKSINKISSSRSPPPPSATKETSLLISRNFSAPGTTRSSSATPPPPPPFQPMGGGYGATSTT